MRKLLEDTVNGDKIVEKQLDKNVATTHPNKNSVDYSVEIDFEGIFCKDSPVQTNVVNDILKLRISHKTYYVEAFNQLITHPVIATFILSKWKKTRWYFYTTSTIFILFLLFYTIFIGILFTRPDVYCSREQKGLLKAGASIVTQEDKHRCRMQEGPVTCLLYTSPSPRD